MWEGATAEERKQICKDMSWRGNPDMLDDADLSEDDDDSIDEGDEEDN